MVFSFSAKEKEIAAPLETVGELEEVSDGGYNQVDGDQPGSSLTRRTQLPSSGSYAALNPALQARRSQRPLSRQGPESPLARSLNPAQSFLGQ